MVYVLHMFENISPVSYHCAKVSNFQFFIHSQPRPIVFRIRLHPWVIGKVCTKDDVRWYNTIWDILLTKTNAK